MRQSYFLITALVIFSCTNKNVDSIKTEVPKENRELKTITLSPLPEFPAAIEGCSCSFSKDSIAHAAGRYLFAANFDSIAYMQINNKTEKLKLISTTKEPDTFGDYDHVNLYQNETYKVKIDIKYKQSSGDEVWSDIGTINIKNEAGAESTVTFYGECGC